MKDLNPKRVTHLSAFVLVCIAVCAGIVLLYNLRSGTPGDSRASGMAFAQSAKSGKISIVYMTKDISSSGMVKIYRALGRKLNGKVAVKLHTGEPGGHNFLSPVLIKDLVHMVNGTIVECNTAYQGKRFQTAMHKQAAKDHGFTAIAPVDIMDEDDSVILPVTKGKNIKTNLVGAHFTRYDSYLILTHFKGHQMGGFGGAIKNMSIGIASGPGKMWIHTAGKTDKLDDFSLCFKTDQNLFLESMAEAAGSVMDRMGDKIVYINVMNNLSIDCDCNSHPAAPELNDIGILASLDPVALDKACVDQVYAADKKQSASLRKRMESRNGIHTLDHAEALGLGSQKYKLVMID